MIDPKEQLPVDDQQFADKYDQRSQEDVHSNGLEHNQNSSNVPDDADPDKLSQAYRAAESSFTLLSDNNEPDNPKND